MAVRNPLVIINGVIQELPSGDTLNGAGGSATITQALITLPYSMGGLTTVNVVNAGVSAVSKIISELVATVENEADDIDDWEITATPLAGSVDFNVFCPAPFGGQVSVNYMIG